MSMRTGTAYESKAIKEFREWGIYAAGLQPNSSPDIILPKFNIGIEVKSTSGNKYYASKNPEQYEYLKNQFAEDFPGWSAYYMIYFLKKHNWQIYPVASKSPFKVSAGISIYDFISGVILKPEIVYISTENKNGGKK